MCIDLGMNVIMHGLICVYYVMLLHANVYLADVSISSLMSDLTV